MKICRLLAATAMLLLAPALYALDADGIRAKLMAAEPGLPILAIKNSTLPGFYEVSLPGGQILFVSGDGEYFVVGELFQIAENGMVNVTESSRNFERKQMLDDLSLDDMVIFGPASGETKAVVTVFTDIDCGFCRKLHQEVPELNRLGVEVRYLAYPRAGIESESYNKYVSAFCADNPKLALTQAKAQQPLPEKTCDNPIAAQYLMGNAMGVNATPTLIYDDGRLHAGYMPAAKLAAALGIN